MTNRGHLIRWGALVLFLAIVAVAVLNLTGGGGQAVAEVNGEKITRAQLDRYMDILLLFMPQLEPMLAETERRGALEKQILDSMVDNLLIKQAVSEQGLQVSAEEVDAVYQQAKAELAGMIGPEEEIARKMTELNVSESDLREFLGNTAYADKLYNFRLTQITEEQARAYLQQNPDLAKTPSMMEVSHILAETEEGALSVRERLLAGEDFAALAEELSTDPSAKMNRGSLGNIPVDSRDFDPAFMAGAKDLPAGEISEPVETQFGWHIIKVHSRTEAVERTFEEIRDEVMQAAAEADFNAFFGSLREKASITYKL
jgi:foldase protein PrsA